MKIVSLQSVGLGASYNRGDGGELDVTVTEINYQQGDFDAYGFEIYTVHTSDGHIRVLPADKYIAEWSE